MNEKTFIKKINSEENPKEEQIDEILKSFLSEENHSIGFVSKFRIFKKIFFKEVSSKKDVIEKHFDTILKRTPSDKILDIFNVLALNIETRELVKGKTQYILEQFLNSSSYLSRREDRNKLFKTIGNIFGQEFADESKKTFIENNIDKIISIIDKSTLLENAQDLIGVSNKTDIKINKAIEDNKYAIFGEIIRRMKQDCIDPKELNPVIKSYGNFVGSVIEKCMKAENVRWIDIKKIVKDPRHKDIYYIGSKTLRIGGIKQKNIPNTNRLLKPIESYSLISKGEPYAAVEILDRVDRPEKEDLENDSFREMMYQLYKELRNSDIMWIDAPHSLGFKKGAEKTLQNMIILDADSIYDSEDMENLKKHQSQWSEYSLSFETRWKREREEKLAKLNPEQIQQNR